MGGKILMFVGDGRLAIFPLSQSSACANLLHAATEARQAMVALNEKNSETGRAPVNYGVGGEIYGNIGSRTRLDFTVIGSCGQHGFASRNPRVRRLRRTGDDSLIKPQ